MESDSYVIDFEELIERINNLEQVVSQLFSAELMYKRPDSEEYEKITDTLDYLHNKIRELEQR